MIKVADGYVLAGTEFPDYQHSTAESGWVRKVDFSGNTIWSNTFDLSDEVIISKIRQDEKGGFVCLAQMDMQSSGPHPALLILRLDASGNLLSVKAIENDFGGNYRQFDIIALGRAQYLLTGRVASGTLNGAPLPFDFGGAIIKLGFTNTITGTVFLDANANGIKDPSERFIDGILVTSENGDQVVGSVTANGIFTNAVTAGTFITQPQINAASYTVHPVADTTTLSGTFGKDSVSFALVPTSTSRDLQIRIIPLTTARPGFASLYKILYTNAGGSTIAPVTVKVAMDYRQTYAMSSPAGQEINPDTIAWNISALQPLQTDSLLLGLFNAAPPGLTVNDTLQLTAIIEPVADDAIPANNTFLLKQVVEDSFDPNDKTELNNGAFTQSQVANKEYLQYIIRFQNTGTDTAFRIIIRDTLDTKLDWSTLEMVDASHAYTLQITGGNQLEWTFNDVNLPDDKTNEPASHGYIVYRIRPKANVSVDDVIHNSAAIYFDFNLPVITNDAATVIQKDFTALPVTLLSFGSIYNNQTVTLHWKTQNEKNFNFFEVERSTDGIHFSTIAKSPSVNNHLINEYEQLDNVKNIPAKMLYYRLKMVDMDGHINYSQIISIRLQEDIISGVKVYPNPVVHTGVTVAFYAQSDETIAISIMDFSGRLLSTQYHQAAKGNNTVIINGFSKQPAGIYTIQLKINGKIKSYKVIII